MIDRDDSDAAPEVMAALKANADVVYKFKHFYQLGSYTYASYLWTDVELVKADILALDSITDTAEFLAASKRLAEDYGLLDAKDDMLRVSDII